MQTGGKPEWQEIRIRKLSTQDIAMRGVSIIPIVDIYVLNRNSSSDVIFVYPQGSKMFICTNIENFTTYFERLPSNDPFKTAPYTVAELFCAIFHTHRS